MLEIFIYSLIISILFTPFGVFFTENQHKNLYLYTKQLIFGLIVLSFLAILFNFFYSLNVYLNSIIIILFIIIFIKYIKLYLDVNFLIFLLVLSFFIALLITESNVYRPDAGLYHLPFIGILNSEKIIIGLSNLHFRYGHASIIQYLSAFSNNIILGNNGIVYPAALLAAAVTINFIYQVHKYSKSKIYNFHFFYLLFVLIYVFYKMNRYGEYGNDAPSHFLVFFLISEIILYKDKIKISEFLNQLALSLFIIQNKPTLIIAILLNIVNIKKINLKKLLFEKKFFFLTFFFFIWTLKNIFLSGCIIYPLKHTCFKNLSWTDMNEIEIVSKASEAWSKGISNLSVEDKKKFSNEDDYLKNFSWIATWSNVHLKHILNLQIPYISFSLLILFIIKFRSKNKNIQIDNFYYKLIIILSICSFVWFIKAPLYRYGYSLLVGFISLIFALISIKSNLNTKRIYILCNVLLIIGISAIFSKNIIRIVNNDNNYNNYPWPKYYSMGQSNQKNDYFEKQLGYKKILKPKKGYYCMYIKKICNHYEIDENLKIKKLKGYDIIYLNNK